ncbi:MAG TPA: thiamine pyrophosphate-binding protein, partial [Reyranella sp.]
MKPEESATTGADLLVKALIDEEVEVVFGYPGGAVLPIYDSIFKQNQLRHILVRHEQAAVHAAEGYARSTGKVGVVLVTSGPGATNAVTGLTDALMDSIPIVCLTGQVPTHLIGNDAFQEADTTGITRPCTKHNYLVKSVDALARTVHEAFYVARSGRPGPVVIDLPKDVLMNKHEYSAPQKPVEHKSYKPVTKPDRNQLHQVVELMAKAKRPVFYTGGGVVNSGPKASQLLTQLVRMTGFPITNTLMGLGSFPASDPQFLGMLGMHGTYEANLAMYHCDLLINIGARFDDRITGKIA